MTTALSNRWVGGWLALAMAASSHGCSDVTRPDPEPEPEPEVETIGCEGCTSFTGGIVFDGTRAGPGAVVLNGAHVEEVVFGEVEVIAGQVVDVSGHTVLPGLFDMHVHSNGESAPYGYYSTENLTEPNMKGRLRAGVTSYLDLGSSRSFIFELRSRVRAGELLAPNLFAAGPLLTPHGGHPCTDGNPPTDFCVFIDDAADVDAELPALLAYEPDVIKIVIEGGSPASPLPRMSEEAVQALGAAAEDGGLRMIAHVSTAADIELALDAGVHLFAHIPGEDLIDSSLAERMVAEHVVVVPTLAVYDILQRISVGELSELDDPTIADDVPAGVLAAFADPEQLGWMISPQAQELYGPWSENSRENFRTCLEAGVTFAAGTDAGNPGVFHGRSIWLELALYVQEGMTPVEALTAGTRNAADLVGRSDLGRLEPGAIADVLIVEGDASTDIAALAHVSQVYRAGELLDRDALSLKQGTSLVLEPTAGLAEGETCLAKDECASDLYCSWFSSCAEVCTFSDPCPVGDACFPQDAGSKGWCYAGDGCDLITQDCENGEACIWVGNGSTICWTAGIGVGGEPCDELGACAPGFECDYATNDCLQLCDPSVADSCDAGQQCVDQSADAGLSIGSCE